MGILRNFEIKHYSGLESEIPDTLPFGDTYFAIDTNRHFKYNQNNLPIDLSGGAPVNGWASYEDTTDLIGSPQIILEGQSAPFINRAQLTNETQLPADITSLWDPILNRMTPKSHNDFYLVDFQFLVSNSKLSGYFTFDVDVFNVVGARFGKTHISPKDIGSEFPVTVSFGHYTSIGFATGGGQPMVHADLGNLSIYNKQIRYTRLHKALI
jgi:hypothetical protein